MTTSPSMAKNIVRRCLWNLVDPGPTKAFKEKIWEYFDSRCAYCGDKLERDNRRGHIDHLIPVSSDVHQSRSIFVLACEKCNGYKKRDRDWREFLTTCCGEDDIALDARRTRIEKWVGECASTSKKLSPDVVDALYKAEEAIISALEGHVENIRSLTKNSG